MLQNYNIKPKPAECTLFFPTLILIEWIPLLITVTACWDIEGLRLPTYADFFPLSQVMKCQHSSFSGFVACWSKWPLFLYQTQINKQLCSVWQKKGTIYKRWQDRQPGKSGQLIFAGLFSDNVARFLSKWKFILSI